MKNTFNLLLLTLLTFFTSTVNATTYYVSPTGSDSNPGTIGSPYLTVGKLNSVLVAGDVAYFRGGTYRSTDNAATIFFWFHNLNGTASNPINIFAYPNEKPIFNMDNITPTASRPYGMALSSCSYLHLKGFTIKNLKQKAGDGFSRGFYLYQSPNCEIEQFEIFNIGGGGFGIEQSSGTYVLNCDVHHCGDGLPTASSAWNGGDCYNCTGGDQSTNLVFEGCRGWMTGDDIWDFFAWNGNKITMKNCWAFWASVKPWGINGQEPTEAPYNPATGMGMTPNDASTWINPSTHTWNSAWCTASNSGEGFKLGGGTIAYGNIPAPTVTKKFIYNCLGFENRGNGFSANMQADASHNMLMENCAAFGNFDGGWSWGTGRATGIAFTMKNNWAYHNGASYGGWTGNGDWVYDGLADNVSNDYWDTHYYSTVNYGNLKPSPVAQITDGDFLSVSSSGVTGPRQADGSLPNLPFLKLAASSKLTDKGVNVGLPFLGTAPDLGPFESTGISSNIQPTANAGTDKIISLPINTVSLTGTGTDPDGTITAYQWSQISGPALGTLTGATLASVTVSGLVQGVYQFQLKVTDNNAAIGTDLVQVTVNAAANQPPVANAGGDQTIQLPVSTATLTGTGTDADGTISSYLWTKVSGPASGTITSSTLATTTLTALVQGVYKFELKVTDNSGAATKDTMQVTVNAAVNQPPVANAGADQTILLPINSTNLSGTGTDADGTISSYLWTKVSGPASDTIVTITSATTLLKFVFKGVYKYELKVTDNNGAIGKDTVQITVLAGITNPNLPPIANAGIDQVITLPINSTTLTGTGTDADGTISSYLWTKVSGPASGTITSSTLATTTLTALVQGVYKFELKVTDNSGAATKDTMQVTVNAAANQPPVANAGTDQTIQLPVSTATLAGTGTDADGTISSYLWTKVSGPASGTITSSTLATTTLTALVQGVYKFELKVTDNSGAAAKDTIQVTVNAAIVQKIIHVNICGLNNPYNGTGWNNWKPNSNTASPNFKYADGAISLVNTLLSKQGQLFDNGPSYLITTTNCPSQVLRFSSATRRARILSINGLDTSKNYSFEFFGSSTVAGNQTEFKINGLSKVINTYYSSSSAKFYNVRPNAAGVVEVQIISMVTFNYLSAFNIIEQTGTINVSGLRTEVSNPAVVEGTTIVTTWPLPLTNSFTVNLNGNSVGSYQLSLVDVSGKLMWSKQINKSATSVNETIYMGNIPDGEYFLQVIDPKQEKSSYSLIKN